jgi:multicomponent Na+:H+ antiporter subunit E
VGARVVSRRAWENVSLVLALTVVWVLMQGELSVANVMGGVALGVGLAALFPMARAGAGHRVHPVGLVRFVIFVLVSLVQSSWVVVKTILRPTDAALRSGIVRVPLTTESSVTATLVANAITVTPGTMTLTARLDPVELTVHVLGLGDIDEFRQSVHDLERRVLAAVTPVEATEPAESEGVTA